uniref:Large ribosomal subunit protein mL42 n=1 Tax=Aotus nancymaae TaxID=37293 RepID=A0A2K5F0K8_AOTNA
MKSHPVAQAGVQWHDLDGALCWVCHKSTYSPLPDDYNCKVELALTSDGRTIVCYHPSVDIPYEHTKPIPRPDPVHNNEETHDQILKTRLEEKVEPLEQGPMVEQLSKMFFTTKHRWYPYGRKVSLSVLPRLTQAILLPQLGL